MLQTFIIIIIIKNLTANDKVMFIENPTINRICGCYDCFPLLIYTLGNNLLTIRDSTMISRKSKIDMYDTTQMSFFPSFMSCTLFQIPCSLGNRVMKEK